MVPLRKIAKTRRGIATGANEFFHLSYINAIKLGIPPLHLQPCIGKASDAIGIKFNSQDFQRLVESQNRTHLMTIFGTPNESEQNYLDLGTQEKLPERYLLAARKKWYEMEQRPIAPIWAAVFGRAGLRFIRNQANILNLTTYHCIYPLDNRNVLADALTVCLNSRLIQTGARRQHRVYGGGLLKFEPKDLLEIEVPDLSVLPDEVLAELASFLDEFDEAQRSSEEIPDALQMKLDEAIKNAANLAAQLCA